MSRLSSRTFSKPSSFRIVRVLFKKVMNSVCLRGFRFPKNTGTPKSLRQAIQNGLDSIKTYPHLEPDMIMWLHLKEYISQKFYFFPSSMGEEYSCPKATWNRIFPEDPRL